MKLMFTTSVRQGGICLNGYTNVNNDNLSVALTTDVNDWTFPTSYTTVVGANVITRDYFIRGISIQVSSDRESVLELGTGTAGSESIIAQIPFMCGINASSLYYFPLSTAIKVSANTRLAARIASRTGNSDAYKVGIDISQGSFYG